MKYHDISLLIKALNIFFLQENQLLKWLMLVDIFFSQFFKERQLKGSSIEPSWKKSPLPHPPTLGVPTLIGEIRSHKSKFFKVNS